MKCLFLRLFSFKSRTVFPFSPNLLRFMNNSVDPGLSLSAGQFGKFEFSCGCENLNSFSDCFRASHALFFFFLLYWLKFMNNGVDLVLSPQKIYKY